MRKSFFLPPSGLSYERSIYIFLSTFRFFTFALAVALTFIIPKPPPTDWQTLLITSLVGVYSILKVFFRFRLWQKDFLTYTILGGDLAVCLALILLTGGADSPYLLYSLLPTTTAALFFGPKLALAIALVTFLNLAFAHTVLSLFSPGFAYIFQGTYLSMVVAYGIFCFLIATITYQTNLNIYRHIHSEAMVQERRRLRREIHDTIAQVLGYLSTKTNLLKKSIPASDEKLLRELEEIHEVASASYQDIREAIDSLETEAQPVSLIESLSSHTEQVGKMAGCKTEFVAPQKLPPLSPTVELHLLRIGQEALNNARKHASPTQIRVSLEATPQGLELVVEDNGRGFSPSTPKGNGLSIMEERANSINGILTLTSSPGQGTEVRVKVPRR